MATLDELLDGNARFVENEWDPADAERTATPAKRLAVVACMDTRYNVERVLGLEHGDAKIIRNAGNVVDDGALRSLVVAVHVLGVESVAVVGHTKCGMTTIAHGSADLVESLRRRAEVPAHEAARPDLHRWLGGFEDVEDNVRRSMDLVKNHPLLPADLAVVGLVYDNDTGRVRPVEPAAPM